MSILKYLKYHCTKEFIDKYYYPQQLINGNVYTIITKVCSKYYTTVNDDVVKDYITLNKKLTVQI